MELEAEVAKLKEQNQELQKKQVCLVFFNQCNPFCDYWHIFSCKEYIFKVFDMGYKNEAEAFLFFTRLIKILATR